MNITHFLFLLPQMTVQKKGYLVTVTFPDILAFNHLSVCLSGTFLPKGFLRAARFHSCLLWSQAVRPINQPRSLPWDMKHEKKQPWDFQVPCCLAKMLEAFMLGPSQYFRAPGLPPVHLRAGLQLHLLLPGLSGSVQRIQQLQNCKAALIPHSLTEKQALCTDS